MNEPENSVESERNVGKPTAGTFSFENLEESPAAEDSIFNVTVTDRARWVATYEGSLVHDGRQGRARISIDFIEVGPNDDPVDLQVKALVSRAVAVDWLTKWFRSRPDFG